MSKPLRVVVSNEQGRPSLGEQLRDHRAIIAAYLDTHITRNHTAETSERDAALLNAWFDRCGHAGRPLFVWDAMAPVRGRERIVAYAKHLAGTGAAGATMRGHLGILRRLFEYVLAWPYVPGADGVTIQARYGPIEQPVLEYDYPLHAWGGRKEDAPLTRSELRDAYVSLAKAMKKARRPLTAARDYTMFVLGAESGLRQRELRSLEINRDLLFDSARVQTRAGKGTRGSGPRVRQTILTPFAQATVRHFVAAVRPQFPGWSTSPFLFLSERGGALTVGAAHYAIRSMARVVRLKGGRIPPRFGWHSLRRSFATIYSEEHRGNDHTLAEMLGHSTPSTLSRYIRHTRAYHEKVMDSVLHGLLPQE